MRDTIGDGVGDGSEMESEMGSETGWRWGRRRGRRQGRGRVQSRGQGEERWWVLKPRVTCHVFRDKLSRPGAEGRRRDCRSFGAFIKDKRECRTAVDFVPDKEDLGSDAYNLQTDVSKMLWSVGVTRFFPEIERGR